MHAPIFDVTLGRLSTTVLGSHWQLICGTFISGFNFSNRNYSENNASKVFEYYDNVPPKREMNVARQLQDFPSFFFRLFTKFLYKLSSHQRNTFDSTPVPSSNS
jgi:hypothetical protein